MERGYRFETVRKEVGNWAEERKKMHGYRAIKREREREREQQRFFATKTKLLELI